MDAAVAPLLRRQRRSRVEPIAHKNGRSFPRTPARRTPIKTWSLTTLKEKLIKIAAKIVGHARYVAFQEAEFAIPKSLFADILRMIAELRPPPLISAA